MNTVQRKVPGACSHSALPEPVMKQHMLDLINLYMPYSCEFVSNLFMSKLASMHHHASTYLDSALAMDSRNIVKRSQCVHDV